MKVFWAWQSDTRGKIGRHFVRNALEAAIDRLKQARDIDEPTSAEHRGALHLDHDRKGVPGSPDLAATIFAKIDAATVVVADVTLVGHTPDRTDADGRTIPGKRLINSNVAIELGYALRSRTDRYVLLVFNAHYGAHEELPFDLRHKGGSIVFNLPSDADKAQIDAEGKKLVAAFVESLSPYLDERSALAEPTFAETPPHDKTGMYFGPGEVLVRIGEPGEDEIGYRYETDQFCYLRLRPPRLARPIPLATLMDSVRTAPMLSTRPWQGLIGSNCYGAILAAPGRAPKDGFGPIVASTQLFQTGELWLTNEALIVREQRWAGVTTPLPYIPTLAFEATFVRALRGVQPWMSGVLQLPPPWEVEFGILRTSGVRLAMSNHEYWGPIHKQQIVTRTRLIDTTPESANAALLEFFTEMYDATGYRRPERLYGFPPDLPHT